MGKLGRKGRFSGSYHDKYPSTFDLVILVLTAVLVNQARNTRTDFLRELTREQQTEHSAIAWIGAGWLDYFVFRDKPGMHRYMLSGPHLWAASLYPPGDQLFGTIKSGTESAFAAIHEGKVVWQNPSLITRQSPEVSPGGNMFVVEGRDLKTGSEGLLLVKDRGRTVVQIAHAGNNASWSSEDRRFVYQQGEDILIYDLPSKQRTRLGSGSWPTWSPNGEWIVYRTADDAQFVLANTNGNVQRTLLSADGVLTPLYWSPTSEYLMYIKKKAGKCNQLMVYKLRNGTNVDVYEICEGYPFWMLRWIRLPSNVPLR